jgi:hypothetical protein
MPSVSKIVRVAPTSPPLDPKWTRPTSFGWMVRSPLGGTSVTSSPTSYPALSAVFSSSAISSGPCGRDPCDSVMICSPVIAFISV